MATRPSRSIHVHCAGTSAARVLCALQHALYTREGAYLEADADAAQVPVTDRPVLITEGAGTYHFCVRGTLTFTRETP
jgi:hypothetical protein